MVKATMDARIKAVVLYESGKYRASEIAKMYGVDERTVRRWSFSYKNGGFEELKPKSTSPRNPKHIHKAIESIIVRLKSALPFVGRKEDKTPIQFVCFVENCASGVQEEGITDPYKPNPQEFKRFQRYHADSMWQGDPFQFRIKTVGKVHVTGFNDDCSRERIVSKAYTRKGAEEAVNALRWALKRGRIPKSIYLDNGKQFISKLFKKEAKKYGIKLIFGTPYHPEGRGKIESYHKILYRELICVKTFRSLSHFRKELWKFDKKYNNWRKQEILGWQTPNSVYNNKRYFNKDARYIKKRTNVLTTIRT